MNYVTVERIFECYTSKFTFLSPNKINATSEKKRKLKEM